MVMCHGSRNCDSYSTLVYIYNYNLPLHLRNIIFLCFIDYAKITVSFDGYNMSFSDLNNPLFPNPQEIYIYEGTKNIRFTCSLSECVWEISHQKHPITSPIYTIPEILPKFSGNVSLTRVTPFGVMYTTAHLFIVTIPKEIEAINTLSSILMVLFVFLFIFLITTILVSIGICVHLCGRKLKTKDVVPSKNTNIKLNTLSKQYCVGDVDQERMLTERRDVYIATNSVYSTIEETYSPTHTTLEKSDSEYVYKSPYEDGARQDLVYEFADADGCYETYARMVSVDVDDRYIPRVISVENYPMMYRQYVDGGFGDDSALLVEFQKLNEFSRKNIELEIDEAMNPENSLKNPISGIVPFNENRVLLASPYTNSNCDYINASWLELNQYIATINPTRNTHQDFLQMIVQTGARMVVMLTTKKERVKIINGVSNRVCYWCKNDEPTECGNFITTLIHSTETSAFTKQDLSLNITSTGKEHQVTQYISTCWEQDATILDMSSVLSLLQEILEQNQSFNNAPVIIHCQDGISKTGIVITMLRMIHEINMRGSINMFSVVKSLRRQRISMVPSFVS